MLNRLGSAFLLASFVALIPTSAEAWVIRKRSCFLYTSEARWTPGAKADYFLCGTIPAPIYSTDSARTSNDAREAVLSAFWMWTQHHTTSAWLWVPQTMCSNGGSSWFGGNALNETWFETTSTVTARCGGGEAAIGCALPEVNWCGNFGGPSDIRTADISLSWNYRWSVVQQNSVTECLKSGVSLQNTALHEIGHAYGLLHDEAYISVMNDETLEFPRNCHIGQGFSDFPFPDEYNGYLKHHKGYSGERYNLTGTAWYRNDYNQNTVDRQTLLLGNGQISLNFTFTYSQYFPHTPPGYHMRFWFFPEGTMPTFSGYATNTWNTTGGIRSPWSTYVTNHGAVAARYTFSSSRPLYGSDLPNPGTYRVWVQMDSTGLVDETDEGDNFFPLDIIINRIACC